MAATQTTEVKKMAANAKTEEQPLTRLVPQMVKDRIRELAGPAKEHSELVEMLSRIEGSENGNGGETAPAAPQSSPAPTRRRRRKGGNRGEQFVQLVRDNPGVTVADAVRQMNIKPNYLYRVAGEMQKRGELKKSGRGYEVAAS